MYVSINIVVSIKYNPNILLQFKFQLVIPTIYAPEGCWQQDARGSNFLEGSSDFGQLLGTHSKLP